MACVIAIAVSAKGGYSFITVSGADLKGTIRTSETALTEDFFAFADMYRERVEAPVDAGAGYEITRYYMDGKREIAFDRLHYYPATGFVYYDGIVNGSSEYDGEWYTAKPEMKSIFENLLAAAPTIQAQAIKAEQGATSKTVTGPSQAMESSRGTEFALPIAIALALAITVLIFLSRRQVPAQ
jgi:hypothetical protein